jgi:hypothetical protein
MTQKRLSEQVDFFVAYKFIKILTQDFKDTDAFKLGIIDKDGKILKKRKQLKTGEEKKAYTIIHTLVWNMKKLMMKVPGLKSKLGAYATALFLLKESCNDNNSKQNFQELVNYLKEEGIQKDSNDIFEHSFTDNKLSEGVYITTQEIISPNFECISEGDVIIVGEDTKLFKSFEGISLYEAIHMNSGRNIIVTKSSIEKLCEDIEEAPETFAGSAIFDVKDSDVSDNYSNPFSPSREKHERWNNSLNMNTDSSSKIKKYIHRNPSKDVIVRNSRGEMSYFYKASKGEK